MIETITSALAGLRSVVDLTKDAIDARDKTRISELESALISRVIDVQNACLLLQGQVSAYQNEKDALAEEKRQLESEVAKLRQQIDERARYQLVEPYPGTFVYAVKPDQLRAEPAHYACPRCMEKSTKSIIQFLDYGQAYAVCPECQTTFSFSKSSSQPPSRRDYDPYD